MLIILIVPKQVTCVGISYVLGRTFSNQSFNVYYLPYRYYNSRITIWNDIISHFYLPERTFWFIYFSTTTMTREAREGNTDINLSIVLILLTNSFEDELLTVTGHPAIDKILNA